MKAHLKIIAIISINLLLTSCSLYLTAQQQYTDRHNNDTVEGLSWFPDAMACAKREINAASIVLTNYKNLPEYYSDQAQLENHIYYHCLARQGKYNFSQDIDRYFYKVYMNRINIYPVVMPTAFNPDNVPALQMSLPNGKPHPYPRFIMQEE